MKDKINDIEPKLGLFDTTIPEGYEMGERMEALLGGHVTF